MELSENRTINTEYILRENIDYNYLVEEFILDINKFEPRQEECNEAESSEMKNKVGNKKDSKKENKNSKKSGKNKKNEIDELALSKQGSKMSIYSTKTSQDNKSSQKNKDISVQKIKDLKNLKVCNLSAKQIKNLTNLIAKGKSETTKTTHTSNTTGKTQAPTLIQEEIVDTHTGTSANFNFTQENENTQIETKKNKNKGKENKPAKKNNEPPSKEIAGQNKRVEDFLKSVKDKKGQQKGQIKEERLSIRSSFVDKHKYLFTIDPSQRLRLRELSDISIEVCENFFSTLFSTYETFNKFSKEEDYIKTNMKDASILLDSLTEILLNLNKTDLINFCLDKIIDFLLNILAEINSNDDDNFKNLSNCLEQTKRGLLLNFSYILYKNLNENTSCQIKSEKIISLQQAITKISENYIETYSSFRSKETTKSFRDDEMLLFLFLTKSLIDSGLKIKFNVDYQIDENLVRILKLLESEIVVSSVNEELDFEIFSKDYNNLKFFTKFSHLFDLNKNKFYVLSIKTSRAIESNLTFVQNLFIKSNQKSFSFIINRIILIYIRNFAEYYESQESLYDEIFNLLKIICDEKTLSSEYIKDLGAINLSLNETQLHSDDMISKYLIIVIKYIKYFERVFYNENVEPKEKRSPDENELENFLSYFQQVLSIILNLKHGYVKEKYFKIMEKSIEVHIEDKRICAKIFEYISRVIRTEIVMNKGNLLLHLKNLKDLIKFYSKYTGVKLNIFKLKELSNDKPIEFSLFTIFYLSFLDLNNEKDKKLLEELFSTSPDLIQNILFIDRKVCSFYTKYYINEEIVSLDNILNIIFNHLANEEDQLNSLIKFLINKIENSFSDNSNGNYQLNLSLKIIEKLFDKKLINETNIEAFVSNTNIISAKNKNKNDNKINKILSWSLEVYLINKLISLNSCNFKLVLETKGPDLIKNITDLNDKVTKLNPSDYLKTFEDSTSYLIQLLDLNNKLKENPNLFQTENIIVEDITTEGNKLNSEINLNIENTNFDLILIILNKFLDYISAYFNSHPADGVLLYLVNLQETINSILANDKIFFNLINNKPLLESFIRKYLNLKETAFSINQSLLKDMRNVDYERDDKIIQEKLMTIDLAEKVCLQCGDFVKIRCREQIVYLFKEEEIYNMFMTKDKVFLKLITDKMDEVYKSTILNEANLKILISKAQNEDEDLLEDCVFSIFSKKVIKYLECPEEIIEFLGSMNEALRYDLKVDRKEFYNSLFSYFYLWKTIMSKIENGFKLYTTDKKYVPTIDSYKTLLKFVINYLEKNTKLYEMFLLIVVSLIHLIDDEKSLEEENLFNLKDFDDNCLSSSETFDQNTFKFLLSVLYKFVKIFPSLVKFYYDESKTKLKNVFRALNSKIILPNMLVDLNERIKLNQSLLNKHDIKMKDTSSLHYLEFEFNANDEIKFLIEVKIPPIFPLRKLDINFKCNALIDERKLLNVRMNLSQTMNSSIDNVSDNLIIWAENVKQLVIVGQEPCPVCYSYLHGTDKSLPNSTCKTCKKRFHSLCMREWFKSLAVNGQKYSCPMCRTEWKSR
jgi:hypothetical protein